MKDVAEFGIIRASKTGSYNHNEIVVPVDLDTEVAPVPVSAVGGDSWSNHNEIVIAD
ncbi:hypothetical protein AB0D33_26815 [Streptomyces sp. NPDC048404]|uniref:hypothetical protein n=1 Tax=unclassified Streptomyces TaxID=2593676 RepID=UPI00343818CC